MPEGSVALSKDLSLWLVLSKFKYHGFNFAAFFFISFKYNLQLNAKIILEKDK